MWAISTLPDTEEILVLFGVMIPLVLLAWPKVLASLGGIGVYPAIGLLAWLIAWGGRGRETAIIGAAASLGLLGAEPIARYVSRRSVTLFDRLPTGAAGALLTGFAQVAVVALTARVAGLQDDPIVAGVIALAALLVAGAIMTVSGSSGRSGRHRG